MLSQVLKKFPAFFFSCFHQSWLVNLPVRAAVITSWSCTNFVVKSLLQNIWKVNVFIWKIEKYFWQIVLVQPLYHRNSNSRRLLLSILVLQSLTWKYFAPEIILVIDIAEVNPSLQGTSKVWQIIESDIGSLFHW